MAWKVREGLAHRSIFVLEMKPLWLSVCAFKCQCAMDDRQHQGFGSMCIALEARREELYISEKHLKSSMAVRILLPFLQ